MFKQAGGNCCFLYRNTMRQIKEGRRGGRVVGYFEKIVKCRTRQAAAKIRRRPPACATLLAVCRSHASRKEQECTHQDRRIVNECIADRVDTSVNRSHAALALRPFSGFLESYKSSMRARVSSTASINASSASADGGYQCASARRARNNWRLTTTHSTGMKQFFTQVRSADRHCAQALADAPFMGVSVPNH